jgi:hypothetical protein
MYHVVFRDKVKSYLMVLLTIIFIHICFLESKRYVVEKKVILNEEEFQFIFGNSDNKWVVYENTRIVYFNVLRREFLYVIYFLYFVLGVLGVSLIDYSRKDKHLV